mmetsp:Transcript_3874/g.10903  ORF Transcript_3874/g.10903 Transcript_3874/m.10903 type:complete len:377 (+) Transcript_3874:867-1997(+)
MRLLLVAPVVLLALPLPHRHARAARAGRVLATSSARRGGLCISLVLLVIRVGEGERWCGRDAEAQAEVAAGAVRPCDDERIAPRVDGVVEGSPALPHIARGLQLVETNGDQLRGVARVVALGREVEHCGEVCAPTLRCARGHVQVGGHWEEDLEDSVGRVMRWQYGGLSTRVALEDHLHLAPVPARGVQVVFGREVDKGDERLGALRGAGAAEVLSLRHGERVATHLSLEALDPDEVVSALRHARHHEGPRATLVVARAEEVPPLLGAAAVDSNLRVRLRAACGHLELHVLLHAQCVEVACRRAYSGVHGGTYRDGARGAHALAPRGEGRREGLRRALRVRGAAVLRPATPRSRPKAHGAQFKVTQVVRVRALHEH